MKTETVLFMELLHMARKLKNVRDFLRKAYLAGYRMALRQHLADIKVAGNMDDYWKHLNSGAEQ
jgi:uncharacterized protein YnzC (UPF0291/DUF896 family)